MTSRLSDAAAMPDTAGRFGRYGGAYVPETLVAALKQLQTEYQKARGDRSFWDELDGLLKTLVGRPTSLYLAARHNA